MKRAGPGPPDIEGELGRLAPGPVPPGLRDRILDRAGEARKSAVLTPGLRALTVACAALIVAILVIDPLVGRHEAARLAALLDGRTAPPTENTEASVLAEVVGGTGEAVKAARLARLEIFAAAAARRERERRNTEARKWLKGWLAHEASEDLI
jgi:hypothetical protein